MEDSATQPLGCWKAEFRNYVSRHYACPTILQKIVRILQTIIPKDVSKNKSCPTIFQKYLEFHKLSFQKMFHREWNLIFYKRRLDTCGVNSVNLFLLLHRIDLQVGRFEIGAIRISIRLLIPWGGILTFEILGEGFLPGRWQGPSRIHNCSASLQILNTKKNTKSKKHEKNL